MATITSANSVFALAITDLYPAPQILQGYGADDAFMVDAVDMAEIVMGIDGTMSAGFVFNPIPQTITLMPDSPSVDIFNTLISATQTSREVFRLNATIRIPSTRMRYTLQQGVLQNGKIMPDVKKTLQAMAYKIMWQRVYAEAY